MERINLKELFEKKGIKNSTSHHNYEYLYKTILEVTKEACRQTLELATKNADLKIYRENMHNNKDYERLIENEHNYADCDSNGADYHVEVIVNRESILNTINQIK